ncbi:GTPase-associated system all-helical protein GASH [Rhizobium leguminosarum]|uniref:GTPase-associated system all-helical protein GASH n=1 Tax=Rhizobium leguminosarum TaxID=384 RepID=UPI001F232E24|nr:GTPase-associated system all-helical protein GASH [Rhizobium leguminosarum]UIK20660.1 hypothetical protein LZK79_29345 [Rhizobium leguminosarum]
MSVLAGYANIIWAEPSDEDVGKRNRAISALNTAMASLTTRKAVEAAASIIDGFSGGMLSGDFATTVERAITDQSEAFRLKGKELQGTVCAAVAALEFVRGNAPFEKWGAVDALALSLWSGLSFQQPVEAKLEELRRDLQTCCQDRVLAAAEQTRERMVVPDVGTLSIPENSPAGNRANTAYKNATAPVVKALSTNAELDREELDLLWWALSGYCESLDRTTSELENCCKAVANAFTAAAKLRRVPSEGYRHIVLRGVVPGTPITLSELMLEIGAHRGPIIGRIADSWVMALPGVFPLTHAMALPVEAVSQSDLKFDVRNWGSRALIEACIFHLDDRYSREPS